MFSICVMCTPDAAGRRRTDQLPAAILAAIGVRSIPLSVRSRRETSPPFFCMHSTRRSPSVRVHAPRARGDHLQRLGIVALHQTIARLSWCRGQQAFGAELSFKEVGSALWMQSERWA